MASGMHSCFAVLPLAIWTATIRYCSKEIHDPVFAPSFVTAVVLTDIFTFAAVLRPGNDRCFCVS
jgi:hypothetical protein